ncbi:dolichyl-diphosphooligosaccharide--protein glycosyltransferase subunit 2 [Strongylocentrotus purpuratus]|uniref:Dolichyl-diphosphooligosaccharide--protein glycosyltransferase subunit 2 n=1 Tax=Strongylocentrotus purpuratus TaxID=7668 RepID=A0A7M7HL63_STRPU|nr:dolichyl-diphosphooligosaccharide--protein glycosyltransferase subunit 2 [Strongylocentrotus purpuratus]|eukprot:XP_011669063.1 PREDICTED: dolichyl-diphosphooligosaccharide--protein glycosyltransferase subunit 2 isoform X1 [Strongylocentrotus purpuratus]
MARGLVFLLVLVFTVVGQSLSPISTLSLDSQARFKAIFEQAKPYADLSTAHYAILGLKLLNAPIPQPQEACTFLKEHLDANSIQSIYHATTAAKTLGNCKVPLSNGQQVLNSAVTDSSDVATVFYAVSALAALGLTINSAEVAKALDAGLKKDDSVLSSSLALHVASMLSNETNVDKYHDLIEDIVAQADEVGEKYLQFDSLQQTTIFIEGAYKLSGVVNKAPVISEEQVVLLGNYIVSRQSTQSVRNAYFVLSGTKALSDNKFQIPVAFALAGPVAVTSAQPSISVRVSNLFSASLGKLIVVATSVQSQSEGDTAASNLPLSGTSDPSIYQVNLMESKLSPDFYRVVLDATPSQADTRLIGLADGAVTVKVTTQVTLDTAEINVIDKDQSITAKTMRVKYPEKVTKGIEADHHQNLVVKFSLKDKSGQPIEAHQTFVRITNVKTKQEVIFTAEADSGKVYKFTLDVAESGKEYFKDLSGRYSIDLIIGDAVIQNPFFWNLAEVSLQFPESEARPSLPAGSQYKQLPKIEHMFRVAEKRPPSVVSNAFTVLVLAPLVLLFLLWAKLGANINNFSPSPSALGFHLGLGGIFALYYCYWTCLNMFSTLQYLTILGGITFLFGNRLLSGIAQQKK